MANLGTSALDDAKRTLNQWQEQTYSAFVSLINMLESFPENVASDANLEAIHGDAATVYKGLRDSLVTNIPGVVSQLNTYKNVVKPN